MLTYLLGDVLRIFSGDFKVEDMSGLGQAAWVGIAALMLIPIVMVVMSLTLKYPAIRSITMVTAVFWFSFNLISLSGYSRVFWPPLLASTAQADTRTEHKRPPSTRWWFQKPGHLF